jgi:hypothetical protein
MATGLFNLKQVNQAISQGAWSGYIAPKWVEYLCVAGGGGGGSGSNLAGGGAGAGGLLTDIVTVAAGASYTVTVGSGGSGGAGNGAGTNGVASVFGSISSAGGGYGSQWNGTAIVVGSGGSGGGGSSGISALQGAQGTVGQGNAGGTGFYTTYNYPTGVGGGGGAGTAGLPGAAQNIAGSGGAGIASAITGTITAYAGGGGGGAWIGAGAAYAGTGGVGGGGAGGTSAVGFAGSTNTGGGGGGAGYGSNGGNGGSGIVVVRYPGNVVFFTGGTVNYNNGYIIHIFTSNGTLAPTAPAPYNTSYQISRSLRFNKADNPNLSRTVGGSGNRRTFTFSAWIKRTATNTSNVETPAILLATDQSSGSAYLTFGRYGADIDSLSFAEQSGNSITTTSAVFRDLSAWYHIVLAVDTTQATSSNRVKIYVNGTLQDITAGSTYPPQNTDTYINYSPFTHKLGTYSSAGDGYQFNGYMAEVNFIDGQQLAATSFGATSTTTGVWAPIKYTGTYGTNGFYLNFSDNTNTTAATLGKDYSGNGNNWTPNNFSVTAGVGNDSLVDSPTSYGTDTGVGGSVRGNYCTLNPLIYRYGYPTITTFSNGNLDALCTSAAVGSYIFGSIFVSSGKWYWETTINAIGNVGGGTGIDNGIKAYDLSTGNYYYYSNGSKASTGSLIAYGASYTTGDIIGTAYDADAGTLTFYKNGTSQGVAFTGITGQNCYLGIGENGFSISTNFGQRAFAYTAPSGFKALCTQNLPTPTIGATSNSLAGQFFNTVLYTGTGSSLGVTGVGFQPDFSWLKARSAAYQHGLFDAVRGSTKALISNSTSAETTYTSIASFDSDGFSLGGDYNGGSVTYVGWNWKANGSGSSNTAGSITSTVSANTTSGFSIVTYTGTGANATVGHGLGIAPSMVIVKRRNSTSNWRCYHQSLGYTYYINFNDAGTSAYDTSVWNSAPTSSVFGLGTNDMNTSTATYVAYCFAPIAGYSAIGSYTGNGSADGPFVFTGMRPAFVMFKRTDTSADWILKDTTRSPYNADGNTLLPDTSDSEFGSSNTVIDELSNGFKCRTTSASVNASGGTYIYMAFASNPFKYSLAR